MIQEQNTLLDENQCPNCGEILEVYYENNGFTPPEGPEHLDARFRCPNCGDVD